MSSKEDESNDYDQIESENEIDQMEEEEEGQNDKNRSKTNNDNSEQLDNEDKMDQQNEFSCLEMNENIEQNECGNSKEEQQQKLINIDDQLHPENEDEKPHFDNMREECTIERVDWVTVQILVNHEMYSVECVSIKKSPKKKLSVVRVKKNIENFERIENTFRALYENRLILRQVVHIWGLELDKISKDLIVFFDQFEDDMHTPLEYINHQSYIHLFSVIKVTLSNIQLLKQMHIRWKAGDNISQSFVRTRSGDIMLSPLIFVSENQKGINSQEEESELIAQLLYICLKLCLDNEKKQKSRNWEKSIMEMIQTTLRFETESYVQQLQENSKSNNCNLEKRKTRSIIKRESQMDQKKRLKEQEKEIERVARQSFVSRRQVLYDMFLSVLSQRDLGIEKCLETVQLAESKWKGIQQNNPSECKLEDESDLKKLKKQLTNNIDSLYFDFNVLSNSKHITALFTFLQPFANKIILLHLSLEGISVTSEIMRSQVMEIFKYPALRDLKLNLSNCFRDRPIFFNKEEVDDVDSSQNINDQRNNSQEITNIMNELMEKISNSRLEYLSLNLSWNVAYTRDIDILFKIIKMGLSFLQRFDISWSDGYLSSTQISMILFHIGSFSNKLTHIGLDLSRNFDLNDSLLHQFGSILNSFHNLRSLRLIIHKCNSLTNVSSFVKTLLSELPFLDSLILGLDSHELAQHTYLGLQPLLKEFEFVLPQAKMRKQMIHSEFLVTLEMPYLTRGVFQGVLFNSFKITAQLIELHVSFFKSSEFSDQSSLSFADLLSQQRNLRSLILKFDHIKASASSFAHIIGSISAHQQFNTLSLSFNSCGMNRSAGLAMSNLLNTLEYPLELDKLHIILPHNSIGMNDEEQIIFISSLSKFTDLSELNIDFSGSHLYFEFFISLSQAVFLMHSLRQYHLILNRCSLSKYRLQIIMNGLKEKRKLQKLRLEIEESEHCQVESIWMNRASSKFEEEIWMPELKQLNLNLQRSSWSFVLVILFLDNLASQKKSSQILQQFQSLNIQVSGQEVDESQLILFSDSMRPFKNATSLTLIFDSCNLNERRTSALFTFQFTELRFLHVSLNDNHSLDIKTLSILISNQKNLESIHLSFKYIEQPIESFDELAVSLSEQQLFNLYLSLQQSSLESHRDLNFFYKTLSQLKYLHNITLQLNSSDHYLSEISWLAEGLKQMKKLRMLKLSLPNQMIRSGEVENLALSLEGKNYLLELKVELLKNEIVDKNGIYFARSIASLKRLQILDMSFVQCDILPCTSEKLCLSIGELQQLQELHISFAENAISSFTLTSFAYSCYNLKHLKTLALNLQDTSLGDEGIQQLAHGLMQLPAIELLDLNLENTEVQDESLVALGQYFRINGKSLKQLQLNLRNNSEITEVPFASLMQGISFTNNLTHLLLIFNQCLMDAPTSSHLPVCLEDKKRLKYLHIYFDENQCNSLTGRRIGQAINVHCLMLKNLILCLQENVLGNDGVIDLFSGLFQSDNLEKVTIDVRKNDISSDHTVISMAESIAKSRKLHDLELFLFEDSEFQDREIFKGLFALARTEIALSHQMIAFEVKNKDWNDIFTDSLTPILTTIITHMQILSFHNYISPYLLFNISYTIWDLFDI